MKLYEIGFLADKTAKITGETVLFAWQISMWQHRYEWLTKLDSAGMPIFKMNAAGGN